MSVWSDNMHHAAFHTTNVLDTGVVSGKNSRMKRGHIISFSIG